MRKKEKSCQTERRTDGSKSKREREKAKKNKQSNQHENNQSAARCKNGRVGYFVLFLQSKVFICGLKWS